MNIILKETFLLSFVCEIIVRVFTHKSANFFYKVVIIHFDLSSVQCVCVWVFRVHCLVCKVDLRRFIDRFGKAILWLCRGPDFFSNLRTKARLSDYLWVVRPFSSDRPTSYEKRTDDGRAFSTLKLHAKNLTCKPSRTMQSRWIIWRIKPFLGLFLEPHSQDKIDNWNWG